LNGGRTMKTLAIWKKSQISTTFYCCETMHKALKNPRIPLKYYPICRQYVFIMNSIKLCLLFYCPWCRKKLPKNLNKQFHNILEKEYGISPDLEVEKNPNIPQEFKSEEWWKKRGL
jgi:hypothetical protein